jgi:hypothetical protein
MVKGLNNADIIGVTSEHNPTLHLWLLSLFIMTGSVASLFLVASVFALNILGIVVFLAAAIGSLWAIKSVIDRMKWY